MKEIKRITLRLFFGLEIILFSFFYYFGAQGLQAINNLKKNNIALKDELKKIELNVAKIQNQLADYTSDPFFREKIAREQLLMAKDEELLFKWPK